MVTYFVLILQEYNLEKEKTQQLTEAIETLKENCKIHVEENYQLGEQVEILTSQIKDINSEIPCDRMDLIRDLVIFRRKCTYLEEKEIRLNLEILQSKESELQTQTNYQDEIIRLKYNAEQREAECKYLKEQVENEMISLHKYRNIEKQLLDITLKYRQVIDTNNNNIADDIYTDKITLLNTEIDMLKLEKDQIFQTLMTTKQCCSFLEDKLRESNPDFKLTDVNFRKYYLGTKIKNHIRT